MGTIWNDRVKESGYINSTDGSVNITLLGNYFGYQRIHEAFYGGEDYSGIYVTSVFDASGFYEVAWCEYVPPDQLIRRTVFQSNNADRHSNFPTGNANIITIFSTPPAVYFDEQRMLNFMGMI